MFPSKDVSPQQESFFWDLRLKDGRVFPIPPKAVDAIKKKIAAKEPIVTTQFTVPFSEVKSFDKTSKKDDTEKQLLIEAHQAFGTPMFTEDGSVKARYVKKQVTQNEWANYYGKSGYKNLGVEDGMVWVAFVMPIHQIDTNKHTYLTKDEEKRLTK